MKKKHLAFTIIITFIFLSIVGIYSIIKKNSSILLGTCHYQNTFEYEYENVQYTGNVDYSFILASKNSVDISIEGQVEGTGVAYHINRVVKLSIASSKGNGMYLLKHQGTTHKIDDNIPENLFAIQHASMMTSALIRVKKIKSNAYLITAQASPLPICISDM